MKRRSFLEILSSIPAVSFVACKTVPTPPVEPPVDPPIDPPIEPPVEPPTEPFTGILTVDNKVTLDVINTVFRFEPVTDDPYDPYFYGKIRRSEVAIECHYTIEEVDYLLELLERNIEARFKLEFPENKVLVSFRGFITDLSSNNAMYSATTINFTIVAKKFRMKKL